MANTRYIAVRPLEPGKPVDVLERDEAGALVGAWHGYWNYNRGTVGLYPNPRNKYVNWPGGRIPEKRIVSDRAVRVQSGELSSSSTAQGGRLAAARSQNGSDVINVIHDRSAATLPILGKAEAEGRTQKDTSFVAAGVQQKIKFD